MEKRGQVNCYEPYKWFGGQQADIYSVNLADGVTPFMLFLGGKEYSSLCYRLRKPVLLTIRLGWYRPGRDEFNGLSKDVQDHILNGGLLHAPLSDAASRQLPEDPVRSTWEHEAFQAWCLETYGRRLDPLLTT